MALAERSTNLYKQTIGSERFEKLSRKPLVMLFAALGVIVGPAAVIETINQIEKSNYPEAAFVAGMGLIKIGSSSAIGVAHIASRRRAKPPEGL